MTAVLNSPSIPRQALTPTVPSPRPPLRRQENLTPSTQCKASSYKKEEAAEDVESVPQSAEPRYSVFGTYQKRYIVFAAAFAGFSSSLSANMYFPALNTLASELHVSDELINLTLTSYMIFQGLAPVIYGDMADIFGRRPAYIVGFTIFVAANIGLALQDSYAALLVLRCLQSTGSSGAVALGNGVVADISTLAERGVYMGFVASGVMIGPAVGPILGGILSQFLGWRAIFWFLVISSVVYLLAILIFFPETGRHIRGNGSASPQRWNTSLLEYLKFRKFKHLDEKATQYLATKVVVRPPSKWPNPLRVIRIMIEKDVAIILFFNALVYTAYFDVTTSLSGLFGEIYGFSDLQIGLSFIPYGVGCVVASLGCGKLMDINYKRMAKANNIVVDRTKGDDLTHFPIEKARFQVMYPMLLCGIVALIAYGWALQFEAPLVVPLILQFFIGLCLVGAYDVMCVIVVDLYPESPSTATAATNLSRCLIGAGGTGVIAKMIATMGRGWCFTFIGAVLALGSPLLWVEVTLGPKWREERRLRIETPSPK